MNKADWKLEREKAADSAQQLCQGCETPHVLLFPYGQAHHRRGRGAGKRDDRLFVPLQRIESNLARWRWFRNLLWTCARGHERLERMSTKAFKLALLEPRCECGLFRLTSI